MRSPLFLATALLVVFVAGVMAGGYLASSTSATRSGSAGEAQTSTPSAGDPDWSAHELQEAGLRNHAADMERQLADLKAKEAAMILSDRLAFYKKYNLAPESFGDDLHVTDAMASFLKMSSAEKKAVEGHLAQIHAQIQAMEKQHLKLLKQTDDSVTYEFTPYPEGKALKDQLASLIDGDLGADRSDLFLASARWEYNEAFGGFGAGNTDVQVTRTDQSGPPAYKLKETFSDGSGMEQTIGNQLPSRYAGLIQLDPNP